MIEPFAATVDHFCSKSEDARVIIEMPLRDVSTLKWGETLWSMFKTLGFALIEEGMETGYDDWEENGEPAEVRCRWGVWRRMTKEEVKVEEELSMELKEKLTLRAEEFGIPLMMEQLHREEDWLREQRRQNLPQAHPLNQQSQPAQATQPVGTVHPANPADTAQSSVPI
jgi:hypothetical protein